RRGELPRLVVDGMARPEVRLVRRGIALVVQVELVEELERDFPALAPSPHGYLLRPDRRELAGPRTDCTKPTISMTAAAASSPRLPTLPPARAHAWSSSNVVMTPNPVGTPVVRATWRMPD